MSGGTGEVVLLGVTAPCRPVLAAEHRQHACARARACAHTHTPLEWDLNVEESQPLTSLSD